MRGSAANKAAILLGATLAAGGILGFASPKEMVVFHYHDEAGHVDVERVTPQGMRVYGVLSILLGVALIWYAASPTRRKVAAIENYFWKLSQELMRRFGERPYYTVEQVSHAVQTG